MLAPLQFRQAISANRFPWIFLIAAGLASLTLAAQDAGPSSDLKESTAAVKSALTDVITQQTAAFRVHDYAKAYTFAAKAVQSSFSAGDFERMVKGGYAIIGNSNGIEFGPALDDGEQGVVFVRYTDATGKRQLFRYTLEHEPVGWKITGVVETQDTPSADPNSA